MGKKAVSKLSDQLRRVVADCGLTLGELARQTGVAKSTLSRFLRGQRALSQQAMDAVGEFLKLRIVADKPRAAARKTTKGR